MLSLVLCYHWLYVIIGSMLSLVMLSLFICYHWLYIIIGYMLSLVICYHWLYDMIKHAIFGISEFDCSWI